MPNSRYHIHIVEVSESQPLISSELAMFLENKAFITRDLPAITDKTTSYSRRCIDACDFVIMVVGDSYGNTNISGVSQLHLSYLTAKTKNKPILIFVKSFSKLRRSRQLNDFINIVEQRGAQQLYYYQDLASFTQVLAESFEAMCEELPEKKWIKVSLASIQSDISKKLTKKKIAPRKLSSIKKINNQQKPMVDSFRKRASFSKQVDKPAKDQLDKRIDTKIKTKQTKTKPNLNLNNMVEITYDAHAYQDGNLKDISINTVITWRRILHIYHHIGEKFGYDAMYRALNEEVSIWAPTDVAKVFPKAHAVSRCALRQTDFQYIQDTLIDDGWIQTEKESGKVNVRELWQLTQKAITALGIDE